MVQIYVSAKLGAVCLLEFMQGAAGLPLSLLPFFTGVFLGQVKSTAASAYFQLKLLGKCSHNELFLVGRSRC